MVFLGEAEGDPATAFPRYVLWGSLFPPGYGASAFGGCCERATASDSNTHLVCEYNNVPWCGGLAVVAVWFLTPVQCPCINESLWLALNARGMDEFLSLNHS